MPRALTEQEKCRQCERLLDKGKEIILAQGIRKVSVDDITKAAGMAKGSFYLHFDSKEQFLYKLIESVHQHLFVQAEQMIAGMDDMKTNFRSFLNNCFQMPELVFLMKNERDIETALASLPDQELHIFKLAETEVFERFLTMANIDTHRVKPGVVHNYVHTLYLMIGSDLMDKNDLPETIERLTDGLIAYIFGSAQ